GEKLVRWEREYQPNLSHREVYQKAKKDWQAVYADQLHLVDDGLTTSLWKAPGL
ncbi:autoinducer-2 kinase, partial [Enterobacter hormaechei]|nr:autoinducer-2 kinase [Enterobacter hormaechei]